LGRLGKNSRGCEGDKNEAEADKRGRAISGRSLDW
jgi:hypothetical protein